MREEFKPVFRVDKTMVFKRMRLKETSKVYEKMDLVFNRLLPELESLVDYQAVFLVKDNQFKLDQPQLDDCEKMVFCYTTIGPFICDEITHLFDEKEMVDGYVMNEMANDLIMDLTNQLYDYIKITLKKDGYHLTKRFSPGECSLDLSLQAFIMDHLKEHFDIKGKLMSSYMINPEKSSLFVYGADTKIPELEKDFDCSECFSHNCPYKRI
ncbi:MAG: hypothetical protein KMY55_01990 [Dethiosulfatibacter sp.]|nr:hypothetical protein [Dethiosulfatibacter sp.]